MSDPSGVLPKPVFQDAAYLRFAFIAYWMNSAPSIEVFYAKMMPLRFNPGLIAALESAALRVLQIENTAAESATYCSHTQIILSSADVAQAGNHVLTL